MLVLILIAFFYFVYVFKIYDKGTLGEKFVSSKLEQLSEEYKIFNNIILPDNKGGTTQIDHIVVSPYGIFVIETKNYTGFIFGKEYQKQWTQVLYKKKSQFQNPIHQNYKHLKVLHDFLNIPESFCKSIVTFTGKVNFKTDIPDGVFPTVASTIEYLRLQFQVIITENELDRISSSLLNVINNQTKADDNSHKLYVKNLKYKKKISTDLQITFSEPSCPICNSKMIERYAKKGKYKGKKFWGCSKYPTCRGIVNIN